MPAKADKVTQLLDKIELGWPVPQPLEDSNLLEQGLHAVLMRHFDAKKATAAVKAFRAHYPDWNEMRIAQAQEITQVGKLGVRGAAAAADVRTYLQDVFQQTHGLTLEFLRDDAQASTKFIGATQFLGLGTAHYLMWLAHDGELPITAGLVRVLDRVGLISRTASVKKARAAIKPLIPADKAKGKNGTASPAMLGFIVRIGEVASRWCDARKPLCHECALVDDCKHGKKVYKDWKVQQERLAAQRAREAAREAALRKKEEERRAREEARARKKAEAEEKKRKREEARKAAAKAKHRAAQAKKLAREKARSDAAKKREEERKRKERQKAEAARKKKAAAKKKSAAKKKPVRKASKKKATKKKATKKKSAPRRKATKKATKKKTTKKKPSASRKKTTKKTTARKTARKK